MRQRKTNKFDNGGAHKTCSSNECTKKLLERFHVEAVSEMGTSTGLS